MKRHWKPSNLVHNIADFIVLDTDWKARGLEHWGIIVAEQRVYIRELIRRTKLHLDTVSREQQYNTLRWLTR